jgi:hypothetical protein
MAVWFILNGTWKSKMEIPGKITTGRVGWPIVVWGPRSSEESLSYVLNRCGGTLAARSL